MRIWCTYTLYNFRMFPLHFFIPPYNFSFYSIFMFRFQIDTIRSCCSRLFGTKCDKCGSSFSKNDYVMRAKNKIFHIECFRCCACARQLVPGDEFALREGGALYCKEDHDTMKKTSAPTTPHPTGESNNNTSLSNNNHTSNSTELCMSGMYFFSDIFPISNFLTKKLQRTFNLSFIKP